MCLISAISYFSINLNPLYAYKFWVFTGILNLGYFFATLYALFIGSLSGNQQLLTVINIVSIYYL